MGAGAFRAKDDFVHPNDIFGLNSGNTKLKGVPTDVKPAEVKGLTDAPSDAKKPIVEYDTPSKDVDAAKEYGYGFWMRFLTTHPIRLINGKNAPWYFVARLTLNNPYDDIGMGDRLLAIW
jgi:hypothetical protein